MRIGTWNLDGRWSDDHGRLLRDADCDVWLLTEVRSDVQLAGYHPRLSAEFMSEGRHWAGILSREKMQPLPDPHPASAAGVSDGVTFCASILPWRSCGDGPPWKGSDHGARMANSLTALVGALPSASLIWGGDWNQSLLGPNWAGSKDGRKYLLDALSALKLQSPVAGLSHQQVGRATIDHIAVDETAPVSSATRFSAQLGDRYQSDHDAYVVELIES